MNMIRSVEHELELGVPASEAWGLYGTVRLGKFLEEEIPNVFQKVELVEGDGGLGSIFIKTLVPGKLGITCSKEKVIKWDNENRIKENEMIEGGYLELGFTLFRIRFEVKEKGEDSSIIKTTIEYELKQEEEASANAFLVSNAIQEAANVAQLAKIHLNKK